jgi:hypothetical protein
MGLMDSWRKTGVRSSGITVSASATLILASAVPAAATETRQQPSWCNTKASTLTTGDVPSTFKIKECDLRGKTIQGKGGAAAVVPKDGTSVKAHVLRTDGSADLDIDVDVKAGTITVIETDTRLTQKVPPRATAAMDPCIDAARTLGSSKWPKGSTVRWYYFPGTENDSGLLPEHAPVNAFHAGMYREAYS